MDSPTPPHPLVAAILAVTPGDRYGQVVTGYSLGDGTSYGDSEPIAARQAVAALRRMYDHVSYAGDLIRLRTEADEIEASLPARDPEETTNAH